MSDKKAEVRNCLFCGRDTKALSQVCYQCREGSPLFRKPIGRPEATAREKEALRHLEYQHELDESGFTELGYDYDGSDCTQTKDCRK